MKVPATLSTLANRGFEYGTDEEKKTRREKRARMDAVFKDLPGIRAYGTGTHYGKLYGKLEAEEYRATLPESWEGLSVEVKVESETHERAEKETKQKAANEKYREEAAWMAKARKL